MEIPNCFIAPASPQVRQTPFQVVQELPFALYQIQKYVNVVTVSLLNDQTLDMIWVFDSLSNETTTKDCRFI